MVASLLPIAVQPTPAKEIPEKAAAAAPAVPGDFLMALAAAAEQNQIPSATTTIPIASLKQGKSLIPAAGNEGVPSGRDKTPSKDSAQPANLAPLDVLQQCVPPTVQMPCAMQAFQPATIVVPAPTAEANGSAPAVAVVCDNGVHSIPLTASAATTLTSALTPVSCAPPLPLGAAVSAESTAAAPATERVDNQQVSGAMDAKDAAPRRQTGSALPESTIQPQSLPMQAIQASETLTVPPLPKGVVAPTSSKLGLVQDAKVSKLESKAEAKADSKAAPKVDFKAATIDESASSPTDKQVVSSIRPATDNNTLMSTAPKGGSHRQITEPAEQRSEQSTDVAPIAPAQVSEVDTLSAVFSMPTQVATKDMGVPAAAQGANSTLAPDRPLLSVPSSNPSGSASTKMQSGKSGFQTSMAEATNETDDVRSASQATNSADLITAPVADSSGSGKHDSSAGFLKNNRHAADSGVPSAQVAAEMDKHLEAPPAYSSLLQSAKLVQRMGEAELRVGIHSGEFGNVDIRTSMAHNQFTAQISVERNELGRVLAAELPNLQNRLSEQRLSSANIILQNQSADSGSSGFQQGSRQGQSSSRVVIPQAAEAVSMPLQSAYPEVNAVSARLDIHM